MDMSYLPDPKGLGISGSSLQGSGAAPGTEPIPAVPLCWFCSQCGGEQHNLGSFIFCFSITWVSHDLSQIVEQLLPPWLQNWGLLMCPTPCPLTSTSPQGSALSPLSCCSSGHFPPGFLQLRKSSFECALHSSMSPCTST